MYLLFLWDLKYFKMSYKYQVNVYGVKIIDAVFDDEVVMRDNTA